ncbi:hypothetical protein BGX30_011555 [Mortierella sp. GBA39]|nr:hypothetical protein BGX30_011555 [Mortierella sp. GBA39]
MLDRLEFTPHSRNVLSSDPDAMIEEGGLQPPLGPTSGVGFHGQWDLVYSQMRLTDTLQNTTFASLGLHATVERGFGMLDQLPNLNEITLVDSTEPNWSKVQVAAVHCAAPRLRALNLEPLSMVGWRSTDELTSSSELPF